MLQFATRNIIKKSFFVSGKPKFSTFSHQLKSVMKFTSDHEWIQVDNGIGTFGITDYAQKGMKSYSNLALVWTFSFDCYFSGLSLSLSSFALGSVFRPDCSLLSTMIIACSQNRFLTQQTFLFSSW